MGKTIGVAGQKVATEKHPHMHGEDLLLRLSFVPVPETPPYAWGRLSVNNFVKWCVGNTPICMGKTPHF